MESIFLRSNKLERALDFERNSCRTKKEEKAFREYIWSLKRAEYQEAASSYIVDGPKKYLRTLISLASKLNDCESQFSQEEKEKMFQALALFCLRPNLFFCEDAEDDDITTVEQNVNEFEKELGKFNREWDSFTAEIQVCRMYMYRATAKLGMDDAAPPEKISLDEQNQLMYILNDIYNAYYYELKAIGLELPKEKVPRVNDILFEKCLEKPWLLPLSHILLIRDAQYQIMGCSNYRREDLLIGGKNAKKLDMPYLAENKKYICGILTRDYALNIQAAFARALDGKIKSDFKKDFADFFKKEKLETLKWIEHIPESSQIRFFVMGYSEFDVKQRFKGKKRRLEKMDITPFSVPNCHIETLALRISAKLELSAEQLQVLIKELPKLFWFNISLKTWLDQLSIFEESEDDSLKQDLKNLLSPLCRLLNPNEYYYPSKDDEEFSTELVKAASILDPRLGGDTYSSSRKNLWNAFQDMLYFQSLTRPALLLSGAIDAEYCPKNLMYDVTRYYVDKLNSRTKRYNKTKYVRKILGLKKLDADGKIKFTELEKNPQYDDSKRVLMKYIIGIDDFNEMTLEIADKFWSRPEFSIKMQPGFAERIINEAIQRASNHVGVNKLEKLSSKEKGYICLIVYTQIIDCSISLIRKEVYNVLQNKSLELALVRVPENPRKKRTRKNQESSKVLIGEEKS